MRINRNKHVLLTTGECKYEPNAFRYLREVGANDMAKEKIVLTLKISNQTLWYVVGILCLCKYMD